MGGVLFIILLVWLFPKKTAEIVAPFLKYLREMLK